MAKAAIQSILCLVQRRCLSTSAAAISAPTSASSFTVNYLIKSCGLSPKSALSASKKLQLSEKNLHKPELMLQFLKAYDFKDTHIAKLIHKMPRVLLSGVEGNLRLKFDFLVKNGFVGRLLPEFFLLEPHISMRSLDSCVKPCFEFLRLILNSDEKVVATLRRCSWLLSSGNFYDNLRENVNLLLEEGVSADRIEKILMSHPVTLARKPDRTAYALTAVKNLGLEPKAPMFVYAVRVMMQLSESSWKKKIELFKSLGWSEKEILSVYKRYPFVMECSAGKISRAMDFYTKTMMLNRQDITSNPALLKFSMDRRVLPRWNLVQILISNKLVTEDVSRKRMLLLSEELFLQKYVCRYVDQLPDLMTIYKGSKSEVVTKNVQELRGSFSMTQRHK